MLPIILVIKFLPIEKARHLLGFFVFEAFSFSFFPYKIRQIRIWLVYCIRLQFLLIESFKDTL